MSGWRDGLDFLGETLTRAHQQAKNPPPAQRWQWATVTKTNPLTVALDSDRDPTTGTTVPLPYTPETLVPPGALTVGTRVWMQQYGRRLMIAGAAGGGGGTQWTDLPLDSAWTTPTSDERAQVKRDGGTLYFHGLVQTKSGTFPTGQNITIITAGHLDDRFRPAKKYNLVLSATNVAAAVRGAFNPDGSLVFVTGATTGTYVDLGGLSGIRAD